METENAFWKHLDLAEKQNTDKELRALIHTSTHPSICRNKHRIRRCISTKASGNVAKNRTHMTSQPLYVAQLQRLQRSHMLDNHWPLADYALATLNGSVVAPVWLALRLRMEMASRYGDCLWIHKKQSRKAVKVWYSRLGAGLIIPHRKENERLKKY